MKNMLDIFRFHTGGISELTLNELLKTNEESKKYRLMLTAADARGLMETRNQAISSHGRVELGIEPVKKIIAAFCTSPYIHQTEYARTMSQLIEVFYYMKNETEDRIGDDELIGIMVEFFNNSCQGSLELLRDREMDRYARQFRSDIQARIKTLEGDER